MPEVGDCVTYVDIRGQAYKALVTAVWPFEYDAEGKKPPGLNLVIVSADNTQQDDYGRQIIRPCSILHKSLQAAPANYWVEQ
jgi:hypothetical protein